MSLFSRSLLFLALVLFVVPFSVSADEPAQTTPVQGTGTTCNPNSVRPLSTCPYPGSQVCTGQMVNGRMSNNGTCTNVQDCSPQLGACAPGTSGSSPGGTGSSQSSPTGGSATQSSNASGEGAIANPLSNTGDLQGLLAAFLQAIVQVGAIFLVLTLVWVGVLFTQAQGNEEKIKNARQALFWTVIGGLILLGAESLALIISSTAAAL